MHNIKLTPNRNGSGLDSKTVELEDDFDINEQSAITTALLTWLNDDCHILDVGDTIGCRDRGLAGP